MNLRNEFTLLESHGKAICLQKIKRQKDKKFEKITDESKTSFNFSKNKTSTYFMHCNAGKYVIM